MRKRFLIALTAVMMMSFAACGTKGASDSKFKAGTYEGTATGFGGEIKATVTLSNDKIEKITVTGDKETNGIGSVAVEKLPQKMVETQTVRVDAVSGASVSSAAVISAVTKAFDKAGVDVSTLKAVEAAKVEATKETLDVDVVVVGAGGAGMTAAIEAKDAGMNVIIVEKAAYSGGNTSRATGGMNAAETKTQDKLGVKDTVEKFVKDTMEGGYNKNNLSLVTKMCEESSNAIDWLASIGAPLTDLSFSGGASEKRIHRPEDGSGVGAYLVKAYNKNIEDRNIKVYYETEATKVLTNKDGAATGILAKSENTEYTINAKSVILATGGFGANEDLYTKYRPELKGYVTTNVNTITGDGITMATEIGANTVDMEQIQIHPTVEQTTSLLITESVRGDGAILVNKDGVRFGNELRTRDVVSAAINEQEGAYAYLIFDQQLRDELAAVQKYVDNKIVTEAATVEELATKLGLDANALSKTVSTWNGAVSSKNDAEFGRKTGMDHDISKAPFYAIKIAPGVHHTMGGVEINEKSEVISTEGKRIEGLYAAGEIAGGIHGGNRIGGTAVTDIVVFGRIAGINASDYVKNLK